MAKAATKKNVAPAPMQAITLALVDQVASSDPYFMFVPADVSAEWVKDGLVETNPDMADATGAIATRLTEKGKQSLMTNNAPATAAPADAFEFEIEDGPMPVQKRASIQNAAKYPFDALVAPTTNADGSVVCKRFFVPATPARPDPVKTMASTVSTAKDRYSRVVGEREYKAKDEAGNEITKKRAIKEYDREFKIEAGEKNGVKGAWIVRTK